MLRWEESFCHNASDLEEFRDVQIKFKKKEIWASDEIIRKVRDLQEEGDQRKQRSGKIWDSYCSKCEQRLHQLRHTDLQKWIDIQDIHYQEADRLWREEVDQFNVGRADELLGQPKKTLSATDICKKLLAEKLTDTGFEHDNELSTSTFLIYKKNITDLYKLCWTLDLTKVSKPLNVTPITSIDVASGVKRVIHPRGIDFDARLAFTSLKARPRDRIPVWFSFDCLFPIRGQYRHFKSFAELEALVNIYLAMYQIIERPLNEACWQLA